MSKATTRTTILGVAVIAAFLVNGCSAGDASIIPAVVPAATAAEAPAAPAAFATGDLVDATTAAELKEAAEGQRGYPLDEGTFVVVNKLEPLPAVVQVDIDAKAAAFLVPRRDFSENVNVAMTAPGQAAIPIAKNTGKRVVVAWQVYGYDGFAEHPSESWYINGGPEMGVHYYSQAEAKAAVDAWLAGKEDAALYAVVHVS